MKIITAEMKPQDVEPGDRFINTTITALSKVIYIPDETNPSRKRPYFEAQCDCGEKIKGKKYPYGRWDRMHTTNNDLAPWCSRCTKCGAGGKKRALDSIWHNTASSSVTLKNEKNNLCGTIIGDLYIESIAGRDYRAHTLYNVRCSCGNTEIISDDKLKSNHIACSYCLKSISSGEIAVESYLKKHSIEYKHHHKFPDLLGDGGRMLDFDFVIKHNDNIIGLIEFQGKQHYVPIDFFGGEKQFIKQQKYDNYKRNYCKSHNYKLIEIPYNYKSMDEYLTNI